MNQENLVTHLLKKATPSQNSHTAYLDSVRWFRRAFNDLSSVLPPDKVQIKKLQLVQSKLFNRKYLVACAERSWLQEIAPKMDAIATDSMKFIDLDSPPFVLVPDFKAFPKTKKFRSILEHEFVHINQAILGRFHKGFSGSASDLLNALVKYTICEYEANLIQLSYFRSSVPDVCRKHVSLDQWCMLRGYTQGLEGLFRTHIYSKEIERNTLLECFDRLKRELPKKFSSAGLSEALARDYVQRLPQFLLTAMSVLKEVDPDLEYNSRFVGTIRAIQPFAASDGRG